MPPRTSHARRTRLDKLTAARKLRRQRKTDTASVLEWGAHGLHPPVVDAATATSLLNIMRRGLTLPAHAPTLHTAVTAMVARRDALAPSPGVPPSPADASNHREAARQARSACVWEVAHLSRILRRQQKALDAHRLRGDAVAAASCQAAVGLTVAARATARLQAAHARDVVAGVGGRLAPRAGLEAAGDGVGHPE